MTVQIGQTVDAGMKIPELHAVGDAESLEEMLIDILHPTSMVEHDIVYHGTVEGCMILQ